MASVSTKKITIVSVLTVATLVVLGTAYVYNSSNGDSSPLYYTPDISGYTVVFVHSQSDFASDASYLYLENEKLYILCEDVHITKQIRIKSNVSSALDLGGHSLIADASINSIAPQSNSTIVIVDSSAEKTGSIEHGLTSTGERYTGCALYASSSTVYFESGTIQNNYSTSTGGGLYLSSSTTTIGQYAKIQNNISTGNGGGIYLNGGTLSVYGATINGNSCVSGGGLFLNSGTVSLNNIVVTNNTASSEGGGIYSKVAFLIGSHSEISGNKSTKSGGGIYASNKLTLTDSCIVSNNTSNLYGGGVYSNNILILSGSASISKNSATHGGGIYSNSKSTESMSMQIYGKSENHPTTVLMKDDVLISENTCNRSGGGLYLKGTIFILNGTISSNTAHTQFDTGESTKYGGGGVYGELSCSFNMISGRVSGNTAVKDYTNSSGGGIACWGKFALSGGEVDHNTSYDGGGVWSLEWVIGEYATIHDNNAVLGGGMYVCESDTNKTILGRGTMYGGQVYNNTADSAGGGLFIHGEAFIYGGSVSGNTAGWAGGGIMTWSRKAGTIYTGAIVNMYGGSINDNTILCQGNTEYSAKKGFVGGAGICVLDQFYMHGGTICGNTINKIPNMSKDSNNRYVCSNSTGKAVAGSAIWAYYSDKSDVIVELIQGTISNNSGGSVSIANYGILKIEKATVKGLVYVGSNGFLYSSGVSSPDAILTNYNVSTAMVNGTYTPVLKESKTNVGMELHHYPTATSSTPNWTASVVLPNGKTSLAINDVLDYQHTLPLSDQTKWYSDSDRTVLKDCSDTISTLTADSNKIRHLYSYDSSLFTVGYELGEATGLPPEKKTYQSSTNTWVITVPDNKVDGTQIFGQGGYKLEFDESNNIILVFDNDAAPAGWRITGIDGVLLTCNTNYTITMDSNGVFHLYNMEDTLIADLSNNPTITLVPVYTEIYVHYVVGDGTVIEEVYYTEISSLQIPYDSFTKEGYIFAGWDYTVDGTTTHYAQGGTITGINSSNIVVYAKWIVSSYSSTLILSTSE